MTFLFVWEVDTNTDGGYEQTDVTVFSRLNARFVYFKLGLVDLVFAQTQRLFGAHSLFMKCIFQPSIFYHQYWRFYWITNQISTKMLKNWLLPTLSYLSASGLSHLSKKITDRNMQNMEEVHWQLLDSKRTLQAIYNKVVGRFLLHQFWEKAKLWNDSRNCRGDSRDDPCLMDKPTEKLPRFKRMTFERTKSK